MTVIPVINCPNEECAREKIRIVSGFLREDDWIHVDVADAVFTFHKTWGGPTEWANLGLKFNLEVHLMVEEPEKKIEDWIAAGAKRLIVHFETVSENSASRILDIARKKRVEVMLASNYYTTTVQLWPYLKPFSHFQVLAVEPGPAGQKFLPVVLQKIKFLRNVAPNANIEVDGGINPETAKKVKAAGANIITSDTYIFRSQNPKKAYKELQKI